MPRCSVCAMEYGSRIHRVLFSMNKRLAARHGPEVNAHWARGILQGMPVLMDAFDDDGCIVVWNAECERVSGYSAAEMIGNPLAFEKLYPDVEYRTFMMDQAA